jgi:hypothetical protein
MKRPLKVAIEIERPWLWGVYHEPNGLWSRVSVGWLHMSFLWGRRER